MLTPGLQDYISKSRASGMSDEQIKQVLRTQGWVQPDIDQAFGNFSRILNPPLPNYTSQVSMTNISNGKHPIISTLSFIFIILQILIIISSIIILSPQAGLEGDSQGWGLFFFQGVAGLLLLPSLGTSFALFKIKRKKLAWMLILISLINAGGVALWIGGSKY